MPSSQRLSSGDSSTKNRRTAIDRISAACERCRIKKVRCNGGQPCSICVDQDVDCSYLPRARNGRIKSGSSQAELQKKIRNAEQLLNELRGLPEQVNAGAASQVENPALKHNQRVTISPIDSQLTVVDGFDTNFLSNAESTVPLQYDAAIGQQQPLEDAAIQGHITATEVDDLESLDGETCKDTSKDEYQGSSSCLSICSGPGIRWIADRIAEPNAFPSANELLYRVSRRLKLSKPISNERTPEPDSATAWLYCQTYFDESYEASFYIIDRSAFESHLKQRESGLSHDTDDFAWYALRNVVYAIGARLYLGQGSSWATAQSQAWCFFENALSVESQLLHCLGDISSTRAVLAMALFAEGSGCPHIEYMLISSALRMAQSKGMHTSSVPRLSKAEGDPLARRWMFWTIYCYEKHIAFRSGRPSAIDDDDVDCPLPEKAPDGNDARLQFLNSCVQHAMILSSVIKSLNTARARRNTIEQRLAHMETLEARLHTWYAILPSFLKQSCHSHDVQLPHGISTQHLLYVHLSYHATVASIHGPTSHPWNTSSTNLVLGTAVADSIAASSAKVAEAARSIVLATREIKIDGSAPTWLTVYYPLVGAINLFVHVLKCGSKPGTEGDIGLLNMVAGYFGYLDYVSGAGISYSFLTKLPMWAQAAVTKAVRADAGEITPECSTDNQYAATDFSDLSTVGFPAEDDWTMSTEFFMDEFSFL